MTAVAATPLAEVPLPAVESAPSPRSSGKIGLTMSGGGLRATLYHLGVVRFLREADLLKRVSHITSVSGGSILAAHLVLNWERYTSDNEADFEAAAREIVDFAQWDLRGQVVRPWLASWLFPVPLFFPLPRWLFPNRCGRTSLLQRAYDRLYQGKTLAHLAAPGRPQLHILTTSMTSGHLVSFGQGQAQFEDDADAAMSSTPPAQVVEAAPVARAHVQPRRIDAGQVPVALAVAASSAFPPLFPPLPIDAATFGAQPEAFSPRRHYLTDGGVFDNLGIRKLLWVNREQKVSFDLVVVSDAQRDLTQDDRTGYPMIWNRAGRTVDLMMCRLTWFENDSIQRLCGEADSSLLVCRLGRPWVKGPAHLALTQGENTAVQNCRTDLDSFSADEINALVHHGFASACSEYLQRKKASEITMGAHPAETAKEDDAVPVWLPFPPRPESGYLLHKADRRRLGIWRARHWASWAWLGLLLLYVAGGAYLFLVRPYLLVSEAERASEHVGKKILLVERLSSLATAETLDDWKAAERDWNYLVEQLRKDPWFNDYLGRQRGPALNEAIAGGRAAMLATPPEEPERLWWLTYEIAKELGGIIHGTPGQNGPTSLLELSRKKWFAEAVTVTQRMTQPNTPYEQTPTSRRRFWALYWGELGMVEKEQVKKAMIAFGQALEAWAQVGGVAKGNVEKNLTDAAAALKTACEAELGAP